MNYATEWCPHCETEVLLSQAFEEQECPNCNRPILPCSICEHYNVEYSDDCDNCPLKKKEIMKIYPNGSIRYINGMTVTAREEKRCREIMRECLYLFPASTTKRAIVTDASAYYNHYSHPMIINQSK